MSREHKPFITKSTVKTLLPVVFALGWPTMLEQFLQIAVQYIDTAMVGTLGMEATAAVGATTTVNWLVGSTASAIGIGFLSYISKALGAKDEEGARRATAQAVFAVLIAGTVFTLVTTGLSGRVPVWMKVDPAIREMASRYFLIIYLPMLPRTASAILGTVLRSAGDSKTPLRVAIIVNLTNVILNFFMIYPVRTMDLLGLRIPMFGFGWGVAGAAAASAISFAVGGLLITAALYRNPRISPRGYSIAPDREVLQPCLKVAIPNMLQRFATSFGYVVFAALVNSLGTAATAAQVIANTVESAFYVPGYGMQTAAATLSGNAIGARNRKLQRDQAIVIVGLEMFMMLVTGTLLFLFAPRLVSLFTKSAAVAALSTQVLRLVSFSEPLYGAGIVLEGMLQGAGKTLVPLICNICGMWGVRILGTMICINWLGLGLVSAWCCMIAHNMLLAGMFCCYYRSGKWNPLNGAE